MVVGAIIINDVGEILLQQRDGRAPSFPNCWTLFGGFVNPGEKPREAILRELDEEINMSASVIESIKSVQVNRQGNGMRQVIFEVRTNVRVSSLRLREGRSMRFVPPQDIFNRSFAFNIEWVLQNYFLESGGQQAA